MKKLTCKISARFHSLTEMSRDRNDQDRNGQTEKYCSSAPVGAIDLRGALGLSQSR